jgi:hypothetical protein
MQSRWINCVLGLRIARPPRFIRDIRDSYKHGQLYRYTLWPVQFQNKSVPRKP